MRIGLLLLVGVTAGVPANAQHLSLGAARWLTSPHVTDYRLGFTRFGGALSLTPFVQVALQAPGADRLLLVGGGGDVILRLSADARPYLALSASGGFLDLERSTGVRAWSSWSTGVGLEVLRAGPLALGVEVRYQELSQNGVRGVSVGGRLGSPFGRSASVGSRRPAPVPGPAGEVAARRRQVVDAALAVMGAPYRWGGSEANGFDCSGLIRYAYAELGIDLPRRSIDQARSGWPVPREIAALEPGDILAFAALPAGEVSHVGLYIGEGRFIHSASRGVQASRLAADDPSGRWWLDRWVGTRRLVDDR